ncbi:DUF6756 family protein [Rufibacter tibetensis]|uniref:Uncharacterized protein n=1 Tax=Rufibacter tibetensis TaxID=512763 RepID=A0A0P0D427_9BACT|nr:DUF6756 family protein [Rufibacter tibetensis]ALJ01680.1 hypothetical protein DC20_21745 [Rufibacter tibetensis]
MFWEERIDILKKKYSSSDFRVPFSDWSEILKNIENRFVIKENDSYSFSNWADRVKNKELVVEAFLNGLQEFIERLNESQNYWVVLPLGQESTSKHMVYDCKPSVILEIADLSRTDFFIVGKKYSWFTYFNCDREADMLHIYKSGSKETPFEEVKTT